MFSRNALFGLYKIKLGFIVLNVTQHKSQEHARGRFCARAHASMIGRVADFLVFTFLSIMSA